MPLSVTTPDGIRTTLVHQLTRHCARAMDNFYWRRGCGISACLEASRNWSVHCSRSNDFFGIAPRRLLIVHVALSFIAHQAADAKAVDFIEIKKRRYFRFSVEASELRAAFNLATFIVPSASTKCGGGTCLRNKWPGWNLLIAPILLFGSSLRRDRFSPVV